MCLFNSRYFCVYRSRETLSFVFRKCLHKCVKTRTEAKVETEECIVYVRVLDTSTLDMVWNSVGILESHG